MESPFEPQGHLSMDVFQSLARTASFRLLHVFCHYIEILLQPASLSSRLVGSLHSVTETFLSPDLFFLFDHLFEDGILLIVISSFLVLL